ncbi:hypothetical protein P153DRAFT_376442 [Dothidotthia symphoricarpi CBS 119687]|uniref:Uncharacterized protein n=1 Tax=Dothidotthia symphoricarpi CBS 119687 TaxID=1392245 RepID=A0A6A6AFK7_9PLEO|nr:uncharacterized protein P153DRAFT_376442 [Dothidotthia symphoricarpi CBS 119687]KAF2129181.1 hypothetical protein P153DRAFT_376442 [Dothidotthia symphoricarpi CBS 119687]
MYDISSAKRVGRDELHSPVSSPRSSPDPDLQDRLRLRLDNAYTFTTTDIDLPDANDAANTDDDETELRLFATPANAAPQTLKIRLSSPGAGNAEPSMFIKKPRSYYFADDPTSEEDDALHAAAMDGQAVLELSKQPWPGCALPWKVRILPTADTRRAMLAAQPIIPATVDEKVHKRARKGKKTRIAIRKKLQASKEKEEAGREKRTRRNREKKLKKKAKGQAKKQSGDGVQDADEPAAEEESDASY